MKKTVKICKKCMVFVEGEKCELCQGTDFAKSFKGRIIMLKPEQSEVAKKMGITKKGIFAIKI